MLGVKKGEVKLVPYSKKWKEQFEEEKKTLHNILGDHIVDIEHMGSTSIEGITAKPIIDLLVGVRHLSDVELFNHNKLKESGYYQLSNINVEGKVFFAKFSDLDSLTRTHILHVVVHNGGWWNKHLFFRDYLRKNENERKEYENFKLELAEKYADNEKSYMDEKKRYIQDIIKKRK